MFFRTVCRPRTFGKAPPLIQHPRCNGALGADFEIDEVSSNPKLCVRAGKTSVALHHVRKAPQGYLDRIFFTEGRHRLTRRARLDDEPIVTVLLPALLVLFTAYRRSYRKQAECQIAFFVLVKS